MISVIIPTYSPQNYIGECLKSLESQTIDKSNYEVIIVLNGLRNPYYFFLKEILKTISFNYTLIYTPLKGVSNARNEGLSNAKGDYICFIDDDDLISSNYLENLYKLSSPSHLVVSNVLTFTDSIRECSEDYLSKAFKKNSSNSSLFHSRKYLSTSCAKIIPRNIIGNDRFDTSFSLGEDALFMATISYKIQRFIKTDSDTVYYRRIRTSSTSRTVYPKKFILHNKLSLLHKYVKLYIHNYKRMSFVFILTRIIATIKN